jgi:hypothetical protein
MVAVIVRLRRLARAILRRGPGPGRVLRFGLSRTWMAPIMLDYVGPTRWAARCVGALCKRNGTRVGRAADIGELR